MGVGDTDVLIIIAQEVAVLRAFGALTDGAYNVLSAGGADGAVGVKLLGFVGKGQTAAVFEFAELVVTERLGAGHEAAAGGAGIAGPLLFGVEQALQVVETDHFAAAVVHGHVDAGFADAGIAGVDALAGAGAGGEHDEQGQCKEWHGATNGAGMGHFIDSLKGVADLRKLLMGAGFDRIKPEFR